jgi:RimJ/RimL family protein N-acetyltransferase
MTSGIVVARPTIWGDFESLLRMKADPEAVKWSGYPKSPDAAGFRHWFGHALIDPDRIMFTGLYDGEICGYVHFRQLDVGRFASSNGVDERFRGRGIGSLMLRATIDALRREVPLAKVEMWIADGNAASQLMARMVGYRPTSDAREQHFFMPDRKDLLRRWQPKNDSD